MRFRHRFGARCLVGMRGDALLWMVRAGAANPLGSWSFITAFRMGETGHTARRTSSFGAERTISTRRSWSMGGGSWRVGDGVEVRVGVEVGPDRGDDEAALVTEHGAGLRAQDSAGAGGD